jgi:two-component system sensor histidine kinase DegS
MAVKEALNNALKHAAASEVRIGLAITDGRMTITITDNGRGFAVGQARARGNGLDNMRQRLAQIGGHLLLESQPGRGTRIQMEVPGM